MPMNNITNLSIDSLVFDSTNFILVSVAGLEMPTLRLPRYNLPGQSGGFVANALYGERAIKIKGVVNAPDRSRATLINNRTTLLNALSYKRDVNNNLVPQVMTIAFSNGTTVTTNVFADTPIVMPYSEDVDDYSEFSCSFISYDPNLYSTIQTISTINLATGGGTAIPSVIPMSLAPSSGGSAIVTNNGNVTVYPLITLSAPLTNPSISNGTVNSFMQLNITLNVGDAPVIIDMAAQTITQGGSDISSAKAVGSTFWGLRGGANIIGFSAASGSGQAQISFYAAYTGL